MNDNKVTVTGYAWAAAVVFLLIFAAVWFASSLSSGVRSSAEVGKPSIPGQMGQGVGDRVYRDRVGPQEPVAVVKVAPETPENPAITAPPPLPRSAKPGLPKVKTQEKRITPRDMFPMGSIARDNTPAFEHLEHPYRRIAELFPSFSYEGRVWDTTGKFVRSWEAELTPTGFILATGQKLFAVANTSAPDAVLFVQSASDPSKFAVYRRL